MLEELLPQFPRHFSPPQSSKKYIITKLPPMPSSTNSELSEQKSYLLMHWKIAQNVRELTKSKGGETTAQILLSDFIAKRLSHYAEKRNDPSLSVQSGMSPYLKFGCISPVDIVLSLYTAPRDENYNNFLEELIVRRELAINFVYYNIHYDSYQGIPEWSYLTLRKHLVDHRPVQYSFENMEQGDTGDIYWNAAQRQMILSGTMHGYMRMYWAKKILEWTKDPEEAFSFALEQNDKYELDACDPNGYTGISWCFGTHDHPWSERPIFGTVRYMNAQGLRRKFKHIEEYLHQWS